MLFDAAGRPKMEPGFEDQAAWSVVPGFGNDENSLVSVWSSIDATGYVQFKGKTIAVKSGPFTIWPSPIAIHKRLYMKIHRYLLLSWLIVQP